MRPSARRSPTRRNTVYSIKRFMGRKFDEVEEETQARSLQGGVARPNGDAYVEVEVDGKTEAVQPAGNLGDDSGQAEGGCGNASGRENHAGRHHRAGLLQRLAAAGDQGRRPHRGPRSAAHHQRADRGFARVRARQEEGREDRGLRPRRRHVRYFGARDRRRRVRSEGHERRHAPGRRRFGRRASWIGSSTSSRRSTASICASSRMRCSGSRKRPRRPRSRCPAPSSLRNQPAVHHGGRQRAEAHQHEADPRQAGAALRRLIRAHDRAGEELPEGCRRGRSRRSTSWCWSAA